ncbi:saccharopine dehydrogenase-like oxidoreductase [Cydia pomonella]|uniref:saccharopine dehydrogenase-like oxidoreductase n=1 Tax=Cydia pomonella TaxID=82600 RepID=UPI002ADE2424|nr:saccharopine dehydrogenase-like oxidoreductase [Cydia pomonella]
MNERVDLVVLGATGFTGRYVVKHLASINNETDYSDLTWGIAGRSKEKLNNLLVDLVDKGVNVKNIPVIECDIANEAMVYEVCRRTKVVVNSTGPYTTLSELVIKTCIQTKTHYVDISAELHQMLSIYRGYNKAAEAANVLIIAACGYGSIPGVMGFVHLQKHFKGTLQTVECYTEIEMPKRVYSLGNILCGGDNCLVHFGTWDSLVHELGNFPQYFRMKQEIFPDAIYGPEPDDIKKSFFHRKNANIWFPYPGPDSNIIDMTQRYLYEKEGIQPVHFKMYTTMPLLIHLFLIIPIFYCYYWLSYFKCFRTMLRRYPRFFTAGFMSHEGPSEENMHDTKYSFILSGNARVNKKNKTKHLKVFGTHPYEATAIAFTISAITILRDYSYMPKGGVLTTGAAYYQTKLIDRLNNHGINFEFISDDGEEIMTESKRMKSQIESMT